MICYNRGERREDEMNNNKNIIKRIEGAMARLERAKEIVRTGKIYPIWGDEHQSYICKSQNGETNGKYIKLYLVNEKCTCEDFKNGHEWCKHRIARAIMLDADAYKEVMGKEPEAEKEGGEKSSSKKGRAKAPAQTR
jgi:hypothetical protein